MALESFIEWLDARFDVRQEIVIFHKGLSYFELLKFILNVYPPFAIR